MPILNVPVSILEVGCGAGLGYFAISALPADCTHECDDLAQYSIRLGPPAVEDLSLKTAVTPVIYATSTTYWRVRWQYIAYIYRVTLESSNYCAGNNIL